MITPGPEAEAVLNATGFPFPEINEDLLKVGAAAWDKFANAAEDALPNMDKAIAQVVHQHHGPARDALATRWNGENTPAGAHLGGQDGLLAWAAKAARTVSWALSALADLVVATKVAVLGQVGACAAGLFTGGVVSVASRIAIREVLQQLRESALHSLIPRLRKDAIEIFHMIAQHCREFPGRLADLGQQLGSRNPALAGGVPKPGHRTRSWNPADFGRTAHTKKDEDSDDPPASEEEWNRRHGRAPSESDKKDIPNWRKNNSVWDDG